MTTIREGQFFESYRIDEGINLELFARQTVEGFIIGLHKSPFHGFSVEFAEHRLYNPGESTRHIDWKVYARTDRLYVKKYEEETNLRCQLLIDASSSMYFPEHREVRLNRLNKLQFSALASAALMQLLRKQRDAFGLSVFQDQLLYHTPARLSIKHYKLLLGYLEKLIFSPKLNRSADIPTQLHRIAETIHKRSLVVIFSDMLDTDDRLGDIFAALQHLRFNKHEVLLFHTIDKSLEIDFDFPDRPMRFIDMETGEEVRLQSHEIKEHYTRKMQQRADELKTRCLQHGIDYIQADIRKGVFPILRHYLIKRAKLY